MRFSDLRAHLGLKASPAASGVRAILLVIVGISVMMGLPITRMPDITPLFSSELTLADALCDQQRSAVRLYLARGGGWSQTAGASSIDKKAN